jgi:hemoglobin/transferrin/lactoferrin receptor protein
MLSRPLHGAGDAAPTTCCSSLGLRPLPSSLHPVAYACLCVVLLGTTPAWAEVANASSAAAVASLQTVVVSGARSERVLEDVPASIDVLTADDLDAAKVQDIRDVVRELPNVSVKRSPQRFNLALSSGGRDANAGFNIRGLEGNRILLTVDGVRMPRSLSGNLFGSAAFGRDYYDTGLVSRVEILRGAHSALYGSDGLGGMVAMFTTEPKDLLKSGQTFGGRVGLRYDQDNKGAGVGATLVGQASDTVQWLGSVQTGRAKALGNQGNNTEEGANRSAPNPQSDKDLSVLGKLVLNPSARQKHTLTLEHVDKHSSIDSLSARGPSMGWRIHQLDGTTDMTRQRLSWDGRLKVGTPWADELRAVLAWQQTEARERTQEDAVSLSNPNVTRQRIRDVTYEERQLQVVLQAEKTRAVGKDWTQKLVYGADLTRTRLDNLMDGAVPPSGERFPLKRFPETNDHNAALFVHSEWANERWSLIPALRYDRYTLKPQASPLYTTPAAALSDSAWSPKLGVVFRPADGVSLFGNLAAGFRAPSAHQVNSSFENLTGFAPYKTIPNPYLKPESSRTLELGARGERAGLRWEVVAFSGRYKDFISDNPVRVSGSGTIASPTVSQFLNLDRVKLSGLELKGQLPVGKATTFKAAYGQTKGRDEGTGLALNSVSPASLMLGVDHKLGRWKLGATVHHVRQKAAKDIDFSNSPNQFATPAYTTLDLSAIWQIKPGMRWSAAVRNVTNKKHWEWTNVRGIAANHSALDAYTAPGRSLAVAFTTDF